MGNSITLSGTYTLSSGQVRDVGTVSTTITTSGSNYVSKNDTVGTSFQALTTSSLSSVNSGFFSNNDASGSVIVALDNAGTKPVSIIGPLQETTWLFSGSAASTTLYAKAVSPANGVNISFDYILASF